MKLKHKQLIWKILNYFTFAIVLNISRLSFIFALFEYSGVCLRYDWLKISLHLPFIRFQYLIQSSDKFKLEPVYLRLQISCFVVYTERYTYVVKGPDGLNGHTCRIQNKWIATYKNRRLCL